MASDGPLRVGLRVVRDRHSVAVPRGPRRRRVVVSGLIAAAVGFVLTALELLWQWESAPPVFNGLGIVLLAAAGGCFAARFFRIAPPGQGDIPLSRARDWRQADRIALQNRNKPPEIHPEDRDIIIAQAQNTRDWLVQTVSRTVYIPLAYGLAFLGFVSAGLALLSLAFPLIIVAQGLMQSGLTIQLVRSLGATELARRRAEAMPPAPPPVPKTWPRGQRPQGSKTALPDE